MQSESGLNWHHTDKENEAQGARIKRRGTRGKGYRWKGGRLKGKKETEKRAQGGMVREKNVKSSLSS
jgi:hypothetical protein